MTYSVAETCQIEALPGLLEKHLGYKTNGAFVDVGAYDGIAFSNTWTLAELGWKGLAFEPLYKASMIARRNYQGLDVNVVQAAIMSATGYCKLYPSGPGSTTQVDLIDHFNSIGAKLDKEKSTMVPMMTLDYAFWVYGWQKEFDLLSIDVEGAEAHVIKGVSLDEFQPKMIIIEMTRKLHTLGTHIEEAGYSLVHQDRSNWIYVHE